MKGSDVLPLIAPGMGIVIALISPGVSRLLQHVERDYWVSVEKALPENIRAGAKPLNTMKPDDIAKRSAFVADAAQAPFIVLSPAYGAATLANGTEDTDGVVIAVLALAALVAVIVGVVVFARPAFAAKGLFPKETGKNGNQRWWSYSFVGLVGLAVNLLVGIALWQFGN